MFGLIVVLAYATLLPIVASQDDIQKPHFQIDHQAGKLEISASKDSADISFTNDNIDLLLKPGQIKRPAVVVSDMFGHGKDKTRHNIQEEPDTRTTGDEINPNVDHKNITWKGRITKEPGYQLSNGHVLDELEELKDMIVSKDFRKTERFHSQDGSSENEQKDETLDQANSIIEKVEKSHDGGEKIGYKEEHPDDAKYVAKAQEILKHINEPDSGTSGATNKEVFSSKENKTKKEENGSNKKVISKFIGDTFGFDTTKEDSFVGGNFNKTKADSELLAEKTNGTEVVNNKNETLTKNDQLGSAPSKNITETDEPSKDKNVLKDSEDEKNKNTPISSTDIQKNNEVQGENKSVENNEQLSKNENILKDSSVDNEKNTTISNTNDQKSNEVQGENKSVENNEQLSKNENILKDSRVEDDKDTTIANTTVQKNDEVQKENKGVENNEQLSENILKDENNKSTTSSSANVQKNKEVRGENESTAHNEPISTNENVKNTTSSSMDSRKDNEVRGENESAVYNEQLNDASDNNTILNVNKTSSEFIKTFDVSSRGENLADHKASLIENESVENSKKQNNETLVDKEVINNNKNITNKDLTEIPNILKSVQSLNINLKDITSPRNATSAISHDGDEKQSIDSGLNEVEKASDLLYKALSNIDNSSLSEVEKINAINDTTALSHLLKRQKISEESKLSRNNSDKKHTIVAWVPAKLKVKKARNQVEKEREENKSLKGFLEKYLTHKRSKVTGEKRKKNKRKSKKKKRHHKKAIKESRKKKFKIHTTPTISKRTNIPIGDHHRKKSDKRSKLDLEVKNAVKELESLMDEKSARHTRKSRIERKKVNNELISRPMMRPTLRWFKRDFTETGDDYYALRHENSIRSDILQNKKSHKLHNESAANPRSKVNAEPKKIEKELLTKVEKAKQLISKNFLDKQNQSSEKDSASGNIDSMLMDKYTKQNTVLSNRLHSLKNSTQANVEGDDDDEEEKTLASENKVMAQHLVETADAIYVKDQENLREDLKKRNGTSDDENEMEENKPEMSAAKAELNHMIDLAENPLSSRGEKDDIESANVDARNSFGLDDSASPKGDVSYERNSTVVTDDEDTSGTNDEEDQGNFPEDNNITTSKESAESHDSNVSNNRTEGTNEQTVDDIAESRDDQLNNTNQTEQVNKTEVSYSRDGSEKSSVKESNNESKVITNDNNSTVAETTVKNNETGENVKETSSDGNKDKGQTVSKENKDEEEKDQEKKAANDKNEEENSRRPAEVSFPGIVNNSTFQNALNNTDRENNNNSSTNESETNDTKESKEIKNESPKNSSTANVSETVETLKEEPKVQGLKSIDDPTQEIEQDKYPLVDGDSENTEPQTENFKNTTIPLSTVETSVRNSSLDEDMKSTGMQHYEKPTKHSNEDNSDKYPSVAPTQNTPLSDSMLTETKHYEEPNQEEPITEVNEVNSDKYPSVAPAQNTPLSDSMLTETKHYEEPNQEDNSDRYPMIPLVRNTTTSSDSMPTESQISDEESNEVNSDKYQNLATVFDPHEDLKRNTSSVKTSTENQEPQVNKNNNTSLLNEGNSAENLKTTYHSKTPEFMRPTADSNPQNETNKLIQSDSENQGFMKSVDTPQNETSKIMSSSPALVAKLPDNETNSGSKIQEEQVMNPDSQPQNETNTFVKQGDKPQNYTNNFAISDSKISSNSVENKTEDERPRESPGIQIHGNSDLEKMATSKESLPSNLNQTESETKLKSEFSSRDDKELVDEKKKKKEKSIKDILKAFKVLKAYKLLLAEARNKMESRNTTLENVVKTKIKNEGENQPNINQAKTSPSSKNMENENGKKVDQKIEEDSKTTGKESEKISTDKKLSEDRKLEEDNSKNMLHEAINDQSKVENTKNLKIESESLSQPENSKKPEKEIESNNQDSVERFRLAQQRFEKEQGRHIKEQLKMIEKQNENLQQIKEQLSAVEKKVDLQAQQKEKLQGENKDLSTTTSKSESPTEKNSSNQDKEKSMKDVKESSSSVDTQTGSLKTEDANVSFRTNENNTELQKPSTEINNPGVKNADNNDKNINDNSAEKPPDPYTTFRRSRLSRTI